MCFVDWVEESVGLDRIRPCISSELLQYILFSSFMSAGARNSAIGTSPVLFLSSLMYARYSG